MKNVLIFPCGSEIGLEIHNALKYSKDFKLFGGSSVDNHGKFVFKNYIGNFPYIDDNEFLYFLNKIIKENDIDLIYPAHDDVVLKLATLKDKIGAEVVVSSKETCEICRSKNNTYKFFSNEYFNPIVYNKEDEIDFPVFLKPNIGQGSKGVHIVKNKEELCFFLNENPDLTIVEYLPGKEYTIDCFSKDDKILFVGKRERIRVKDGISVNAKTLDTDEKVKKIAEVINDKLSLRGAWFFQLKIDKSGNYKLLEVAPRIAGTMSLYRNKGINFPLLTLYCFLNIDIKISPNINNLTIDRALTNKFEQKIDYERVFVDFDDTLIFNGKINSFLIMFLYQCVNEKKEIILITKHKYDISRTLKKFKIDVNLFDKIIHVEPNENKYEFIDENISSIFIDDSFSEREEILKHFKFPVFDLDAIESLLNWKM